MIEVAEGACNGAIQIGVLAFVARWYAQAYLGRSDKSVIAFSVGVGALLAGGGIFALDDPNGWEAAGRFVAGAVVLVALWWAWFKKPKVMRNEQVNG